MKLSEKIIIRFLNNLDEKVDETTKIAILQNNGRACFRDSFDNLIKKGQKIYQKAGDINEFAQEFQKVYNHLVKEENGFYIVYPQCYCSAVNKIPNGELPKDWCHCSVGWVKELFKQITGTDIEVELISSIKHGQEECRFHVLLENVNKKEH
jgi:predicted hydrocarbon binding protein